MPSLSAAVLSSASCVLIPLANVGAADYVRTIDGVQYSLAEFNYYNAATNSTNYRDVMGRLYIPPGYDPAKPSPVVMFLAGLGENGHDNVSQVNSNIDNLLKAARSRNFILYAPQSEDGWWPELPKAVNMLGRLATQYNVDPSRLYVTGLSAGGGGTQAALAQYTNLFSAYVPIALARNAFTSTNTAAVAVGRPTWYYVARDDSQVTGNRNTVKYIVQAQGGATPAYPSASDATNDFLYTYGTLHYTEYATGGHSIATWGRAYGESQMYDWMLQQSSPVASPAGGQSVWMNFSNSSVPAGTLDAQGNRWNVSGGYGFSSSTEFALAYAQDITGARTTVSAEVKTAFGGTGTSVPAITAFADPTVAGSYWLTATNTVGELVIHGLKPGAAYDLSLFAAIVGNDGNRGHKGLYSVDGQSVLFDSSDNLSQFVNFSSVHADASGNLLLSVAPTGGSRWAALNTLQLSPTVVPEPVLLGVLPLGLLAMRRARRGR